MFGYIFAAAHVGVKHELVRGMQIRDVDPRVSESEMAKIPMIHVGRAWFPKDYLPGWQWHNPEGKDFKHFGNQVWCKCNYTAADIIPWPLPLGIDAQSKYTLTMIHDSYERFL